MATKPKTKKVPTKNEEPEVHVAVEHATEPAVQKVQIAEADPAKPRFVVKIVTYLDECQRRVQEKHVVEGEHPAGMCAWSGAGIMLMPNPDGGDPLQAMRNFDIPGATTVQEAYGLFDTFWNMMLKTNGATSGLPEAKAAPFIVRVDQLMDNNLQRVQEHICIVGEFPAKYPRFRGAGIIRLPDGQELLEEFMLEGAETVTDAFKLYPAVHTEVARRTGEQFRQFHERLAQQQDRAAMAQKRMQMAAAPKGVITPIKEKEDKTGRNAPLIPKKSNLVLPTGM